MIICGSFSINCIFYKLRRIKKSSTNDHKFGSIKIKSYFIDLLISTPADLLYKKQKTQIIEIKEIY